MDPVTPRPRRGVLFYVGAAGLLAIMLIESIAVMGRHLRLPLLGALEMAQAAIVPAACASMAIASLAGTHAAVHLLTERLPERWRSRLGSTGALLAALFFGALAVGSAWLTAEFWQVFEQTDVLAIPFRPLRLLVTACATALAVLFLALAWRGGRR